MPKTFLQITNELAIWKFFPAGNDRAALALKIAEWCRDKPERGEYLLTKVDDFDEYPGPATIRKLVKDKFEPAGALSPYQLDRRCDDVGLNPEVLPPVKCNECRDTGNIHNGKVWDWCDCPAGIELKADNPDWINVANGYRQPGQALREAVRAKATHEKLEQLMGGYGV